MSVSRFAIITLLDNSGRPDNSLPEPGGNPDNSLPPFPGYPGHPLPIYPGGPNQDLPNRPGRPSNDLPGWPGFPVHLPIYPFDPTVDNSLPTPPPQVGGGPIVRIGAKFVVKWLACHGFILVPDNSLPGDPESPDQSLPPFAQPK